MPDETTDRYRRAAEAFIAHPLLKAGPARDETVAWWATQPSFRRAVDANRDRDEAAGREAAAQAIQDHADRHAPRDTGGAFRRHLLAAARIALGPLSREEAAKAFSAAVAKLKDDTDG